MQYSDKNKRESCAMFILAYFELSLSFQMRYEEEIIPVPPK